MSEDLIRRSDAIKAITDISKNYTGKGKRDYHPHIDFLVDALKYDVPSIDIVRCKECKHWRNTDAEKIPTASIACGNMHADDFCSYGEREGE